MVYLNYGRALQLLIQDLINLIKKGPMNFQMLIAGLPGMRRTIIENKTHQFSYLQ